MNVCKFAVLLFAAISLSGCKSAYRIQNYQAPVSRLQPEAGVFIVVPPDAFDEPGSGRFAADALRAAFKTRAQRIEQSTEILPLSVQLTNAASLGCAYLVDPVIYKWEEEPTEWSGKSDILDIHLRLLNTPEGAVVSETRFDGKSKWMTFGGDRVEHLLKAFATEWVRALYEGTDFKAPTSGSKGGK